MAMHADLIRHQPVAGQFLSDLSGGLEKDRRLDANDKTEPGPSVFRRAWRSD
jgi:hypothetical protein